MVPLLFCSLVKCFITVAGCEDLASALISNQNLKILQIGCNEIGDVGVKLLCGALTHPNCRLEVLGWVLPNSWLYFHEWQRWRVDGKKEKEENSNRTT